MWKDLEVFLPSENIDYLQLSDTVLGFFLWQLFFKLATQMLQFHGSVELPTQSVPLFSQHWDCSVIGWYRETNQFQA